jgi:hypothetical protein
VVETPHLSVWSVISVLLSALAAKERSALLDVVGLNSAALRPSCPGSAAAAGVSVTSSSGGLVKWCAGEEDGQPVLPVADNRSIAVEVDYPPHWSVSRDDWPDLDTAIADEFASHLTIAPPGESSVIIGGGDTVTFRIPPGASGTASAVPSSEGYLWSGVLFGLDTLVMTTEAVPFTKAPKASTLTSAVQLVFSARDCVSSFVSLAGSPVTSVSQAANVFWQAFKLAAGCLKDVWGEAYGVNGAVTACVAGLALWLINGLQLVGGGLYAAVESVVYWDGYRMTVTEAALACPSAAILPAAEQWASQYGGSITDIQSFQCAGNFAYAFADDDAQGNVNSVTLLFMASGTGWVSVDRGTYCQDGSVPQSIYFNACETQ